MVTCFTRSPRLKKAYEDPVAMNPLHSFSPEHSSLMVIFYIDTKSCNFIRDEPSSLLRVFFALWNIQICSPAEKPSSLTRHGMDPKALHCLELRLPRVEGWQERQDCQAMAMQNPTYFFHKPLFCAAFELNSKESRGHRYNPYPTSPHTYICSSNVLNEKLIWLLTLSLAALCLVQVVKASLEHGKGNLQLWRHNHPPQQLLKSVSCMGEWH